MKTQSVKDCTFKPQINAVSEMIATSRAEAVCWSVGRRKVGQPAWCGFWALAGINCLR